LDNYHKEVGFVTKKWPLFKIITTIICLFYKNVALEQGMLFLNAEWKYLGYITWL